MIAGTPPVARVVVYEGPGSRPLESNERLELVSALLDRGYCVSCVRPGHHLPDLGHRQLVAVGKFDQPTAQLPEVRGQDFQLQLCDVSGLNTSQIVQAVSDACDRLGEHTAAGWKPWFPVIDFDRCTNCMQCLSFCLFDVYGVTSDGKITVQNQSNCKTDCPACSRVCPEVAILFPKYKAGPINGDEINDDDLRREAMKVDISALLGGDIYSLLRDRSAKAKSRFSKERDDQRALKERQRCLKALQQSMDDMDIPAEVLASLPSADEIRAKAEAARKRAGSALDPNYRDPID